MQTLAPQSYSQEIGLASSDVILLENPELMAGISKALSMPNILRPEVQTAEYVLQHSTGFQYVNEGMKSRLCRYGDYAVKISTVTSGISTSRQGPRPPDNLIAEHQVMSALHYYLGERHETRLIAPEQYFAVKTIDGKYLSVQQMMIGWISLQSWFENTKISRDVRHDIALSVAERIDAALKGCPFGLAFNDLVWPKEFIFFSKGPLNTGNVLVRANTKDPNIEQLCIIDQPSSGIIAKAATLAAKIYMKNAVAKTPA